MKDSFKTSLASAFKAKSATETATRSSYSSELQMPDASATSYTVQESRIGCMECELRSPMQKQKVPLQRIA